MSKGKGKRNVKTSPSQPAKITMQIAECKANQRLFPIGKVLDWQKNLHLYANFFYFIYHHKS